MPRRRGDRRKESVVPGGAIIRMYWTPVLASPRFDSADGLAMYSCKSVENDTATLLASDPVLWETYSTIIEGRQRHRGGGDDGE